LNEKLQEVGAELVLPGLKVELSPSSEEMQECRQYGSEFVGYVRSRVRG
jgi:flavodoxin I